MVFNQGIAAGVEYAIGVPVNLAGEILVFTIAGMLFMMILLMILLGLSDVIKRILMV